MINSSLNKNSYLNYSMPLSTPCLVMKTVMENGIYSFKGVVENVDNHHLDDIQSSDLSILSLRSIGADKMLHSSVVMRKMHDMSVADLAQVVLSNLNSSENV